MFHGIINVDALFTNVLVEEIIKTCINGLFKSEMTVSRLNRKEMFEMLSLTLKKSIILFDNEHYSQIDGVAMGFLLGPTLANIFLCYHESNWLKDFPKDFKSVYYKRYGMIFLFCLTNQNMRIFFLNIFNEKDKNIRFSIENVVLIYLLNF